MVEHSEFPPPPMTPPVAIGHLSDPHLTTPVPDRIAGLGLKRLLSYLSWQRKRRHRHLPGILAAVLADIPANPVDHLLVTGDLTQLGLAGECDEALHWLLGLGDPRRISVIPGNHDRLVADDWARTAGRWRDFFAEDPLAADCQASGPDSGPDGAFPFLRRCGPVALVGLNSAVPTAPLFASGRLGDAQLERLGARLESLGRQQCFRLVFMHHSPLPHGHAWRKRLRDAAALQAVLRSAGAELVVHGHGHHQVFATVAAEAGVMLVVGAPSASLAGERQAGWNRYVIERTAAGWNVTVELRRLESTGVILLESRTHALPRGR